MLNNTVLLDRLINSKILNNLIFYRVQLNITTVIIKGKKIKTIILKAHVDLKARAYFLWALSFIEHHFGLNRLGRSLIMLVT